jgi:hypothetical protein
MENTSVQPIKVDRRLRIPLLCLIPTIIVLAVSYVTSQNVPAYHTKTDIEDILKGRDREKLSDNMPKEAGLTPERPQTERGFIAERQKILKERRDALRSVNANRNYESELKLLDDEKKEVDARQAATNERFIRNAGRISWGSYTMVYLILCGVAIGAGLFSICKVMDSGPRIKVIIAALLASAGIGALASQLSNYWMPPGVIADRMSQDWPKLIDSFHFHEFIIVAVGFLLAIACSALTWALPVIGKPPTLAIGNDKIKSELTPSASEGITQKESDSLAAEKAKNQESVSLASDEGNKEKPSEPAPSAPEEVVQKEAGSSAAATGNHQYIASSADGVKEELGRRGKMLRIILYLAAAVLVSRVLQSNAFVNWALAYFDMQGINEAFDNFRRSVITQESLGYTVVLAALYLPAFIVLRERAIKYAQSRISADKASGVTTSMDLPAFLKANGLTFSIREQLPRIVTILSPMLAGPTAALLSKLLGGSQ